MTFSLHRRSWDRPEMYRIYSLAYLFALAALLPYEYLKRPRGARKQWLRERFGSPGISVKDSSVWIHAVSVGETIAAVPLVKGLKERHPSREVVLSTVTDTGRKVAQERLAGLAQIVYIPFDLPRVLKRAIAKIKPSLFIIMETELWPNVIRLLQDKGVPVVLMNGRMSERSSRGYRKIRFFMSDLLGRISLFCMQDEIYAERITGLGADPSKVKVIGSFKFDTRPSSPVPEWTEIFKEQPATDSRQSLVGSRLSGAGEGAPLHPSPFTPHAPVIIAGSTHRPEEEIILEAFEKVRAEFSSLSLILAPRHPERFGEVEELLKKRGIAYLKRSEINTGHPSPVIRRGVVVLLDVIGELGAVYGAADIAVMGGSFIEHGGQNLLEPAFWGRPILCGPHMENFPFVQEFYGKGGAKQVDRDSLAGELLNLLASPEKAASMGTTAKRLYEKNSGAVGRAVELLGRYL